MKKIMIFGLCMIIISSIAYAQYDAPGSDTGGDFDSDSGGFDGGFGDSDSDPWGDDNFGDSFADNPGEGFSQDADKAWGEIESDPSMMEDPAVADAAFENDPVKAANMVNKDTSLLDDPNVADHFNTAAINDVHILNDNPAAKQAWFSKQGITDQGAQVTSYNGNTITTTGAGGTTFNINEHPGASVLATGELVMGSGVTVGGAIVTQNTIAGINIQGGHTVIPDDAVTYLTIDGGTVESNENIYKAASGDPMKVSKNLDGAVTVGGTEVIGMDSVTGETALQFTGEITEHPDQHLTIGKNTDVTMFKDGYRYTKYDIEKATEYYNVKGGCDGSSSCIEELDNDLRVVALDNNNINVNMWNPVGQGPTKRNVVVDAITDDSMVTLNRGGGSLAISKDPMTAKGHVVNINLELTTTMNNKEYNLDMVKPAAGQESITKQKFMDNMEYLLDSGYSVHDIAFSYQKNFYGSLDYYGGILSGPLKPLSIAEGEQGSQYDDPNLKSTMEALFPNSRTVRNIKEGDQNIKISHIMAGIAASANTNSLWGAVKTWANTDGGDSGQVFFHTAGNLLGGNLKIASGYRSDPEIKGNSMGRELAPEFAGNTVEENTNSAYVLGKFEDSFDRVIDAPSIQVACSPSSPSC